MPRARRPVQLKKPVKRLTKAKRIELINGQITKLQGLIKRPQGLPPEEKFQYEHAIVILEKKRKALKTGRK